MSRVGESCYRVPVRPHATVSRFLVVKLRIKGPSEVVERTKPQKSVWAPIVSALTPELALAKVQTMYPDATAGPPELTCPPRTHEDYAGMRTIDLTRAGFE